jgi:hypothetical protein
MKSKIVVTLLIVLCILLIQACRAPTTEVTSDLATHQSIRPTGEATPTIPDPHHHNVDINNNWLWQQNASDFEMVKVSDPVNVAQETENQQGTFSAFTTCHETCRIFVKNLVTDETYEVRAPSFLSSRPFSELAWVNEEILAFDQWTQPHHGVHYAVNVQERELILASPFPD